MRRVLTLLLFGALVVGPVTHAQTIVIKGSNTFGEELGGALIAEFRKQHPQITVDLESRGSATGFAALLDGTT